MPGFTFQHLHLRSPDPEATAQFYATMLGAEVVRWAHKERNGIERTGIDLKLGGIDIFIAPLAADGSTAPPPRSPHQGLDHFGLAVDDINAAAAAMKANGAVFTMEPTTVHPGVRIAFLLGPQDVCIELVDNRRGRKGRP